MFCCSYPIIWKNQIFSRWGWCWWSGGCPSSSVGVLTCCFINCTPHQSTSTRGDSGHGGASSTSEAGRRSSWPPRRRTQNRWDDEKYISFGCSSLKFIWIFRSLTPSPQLLAGSAWTQRRRIRGTHSRGPPSLRWSTGYVTKPCVFLNNLNAT